ncbi:MAG: hypothetical protein XD42_1112 [Thermodesulfobacterium sp. 37_54]|jgi:hypothetical protein|nr:MAG: hypothetical protein XD42_1112 [Thermodesulfobacterium sp. 37_54]KUK18940.1 MAG: hypothetical protein XD55_0993 [Thermodesulfobacterium commune]MBZ4681505.1 hypothetical protein [Thermodesulfobacterium sp.]MDK2861868.1 hypothetical protein [Thermodesulfobacterium sp.]
MVIGLSINLVLSGSTKFKGTKTSMDKTCKISMIALLGGFTVFRTPETAKNKINLLVQNQVKEPLLRHPPYESLTHLPQNLLQKIKPRV